MFGLFGKKKSTIDKLIDSLDERSVKTLGATASLLLVQLLPFQRRQNYKLELQSQFSRGYIFGFIYAAIKASGLRHAAEEDAMMRIIAGHDFILHDQQIDAFQYVRESVSFQENATYGVGYQKGIDEALDCFGPDQKKPFGLSEYFASHCSMN